MNPGFAMWRSARAVVALACVLLLVLPLLLLGFAYGYETVILRRIQRDLLALSTAATHVQPQTLAEFGRRGKVLAYLLDKDGSVRADSGASSVRWRRGRRCARR